MDDKIKQVLIVRKDLKMRKGKAIAQGAHASLASFLNKTVNLTNSNSLDSEFINWQISINREDPLVLWLQNDFTKIVLGIDSLEALLELEEKAKNNGIYTTKITDKGLTEFHGEPTITVLALGPDYSSKLDPITGKLELL